MRGGAGEKASDKACFLGNQDQSAAGRVVRPRKRTNSERRWRPDGRPGGVASTLHGLRGKPTKKGRMSERDLTATLMDHTLADCQLRRGCAVHRPQGKGSRKKKRIRDGGDRRAPLGASALPWFPSERAKRRPWGKLVD